MNSDNETSLMLFVFGSVIGGATLILSLMIACLDLATSKTYAGKLPSEAWHIFWNNPETQRVLVFLIVPLLVVSILAIGISLIIGGLTNEV